VSDVPDADTVAELAATDQAAAGIRDSVTEAAHIAAYYATLLAAGVPTALAGRLTTTYQDYRLHGDEGDDDE
jgi:hypothetical protein